MNRRRAVSLVAGFAGLLLLLPGSAAGVQRARLRVTGGPVQFNAPTVADFDAGYIDATGALTYTISGRGAPRNRTPRTTIISIRASSAVMNGTVPIATLQWRRADLVAWNALTTSDVTVESRPFVRNQTNDPWSNQLFFRLNLSYAVDVPGTYSVNLIITITATTP